MNRFLPKYKAAELLHNILAKGIPTAYDPEKHRLIIFDNTGNEQLYFRLPITLDYSGTSQHAESEKVNYVVLLIQSGSCAVGYFENGKNLNHKVFRSYMVRKKQGKSQIKYLKTKGKSRAGSRVRLGETVEFFENINGRLQEYFEDHEIHRIAISCSKTLIPYLFNSKVSTPFDKNDPRLFKIPKHIHTPVYEILLDANRFLLRGELIYDEAQQSLVDELLGKDSGLPDNEDEPWYEAHEPDELEEEEIDEDEDEYYLD
ncbi:hypothetical protein [Pontibacter vulgaris]|uniref:hypothetical protein n=1 Tax=Pontibacter vulgaris TaxID=2905679 RepID=UPI001FA7BE60|nr:hypothetical protein [Pontibacter vulgaris]